MNVKHSKSDFPQCIVQQRSCEWTRFYFCQRGQFLLLSVASNALATTALRQFASTMDPAKERRPPHIAWLRAYGAHKKAISAGKHLSVHPCILVILNSRSNIPRKLDKTACPMLKPQILDTLDKVRGGIPWKKWFCLGRCVSRAEKSGRSTMPWTNTDYVLKTDPIAMILRSSSSWEDYAFKIAFSNIFMKYFLTKI